MSTRLQASGLAKDALPALDEVIVHLGPSDDGRREAPSATNLVTLDGDPARALASVFRVAGTPSLFGVARSGNVAWSNVPSEYVALRRQLYSLGGLASIEIDSWQGDGP
jgi:hypothetical protein